MDELQRKKRNLWMFPLGTLGRDVRFLGLSDGACYAQDDLMRGVAQTIGDFQPDMVFAPDPCVSSECHADHLNVGEAVRCWPMHCLPEVGK